MEYDVYTSDGISRYGEADFWDLAAKNRSESEAKVLAEALARAAQGPIVVPNQVSPYDRHKWVRVENLSGPANSSAPSSWTSALQGTHGL